MSLSYTGQYLKNARSATVQENWFAMLYYDGGSSYLGIADSDVIIDSNQFYGVVLDWGEITASIDLINSKSALSDVTIICKDINLKKELLSNELFGGSKKYINRTIKIYSRLNNDATFANAVQIFQGKLKNVSCNYDEISLVCETYDPSLNITIPQTKSTNRQIYAPIAYGNFANNTNFCNGKLFYPCPTTGMLIYAITTNSIASGLVLHYYDSNLDKFLPIASSSGRTYSRHGVNEGHVGSTMERSFYWQPSQEASGNDFDDPEDAYDNNSLSFAFKTATGIGNYDLYIKAAEPDLGKATALTINGKFGALINSYSGAAATITLKDYLYDTDNGTIVARTASNGETINSSYSRNMLAQYVSANDQLPDELRINLNIDEGGGAINATGKVYDIYYTATYEVDLSSNSDYMATMASLKEIKHLYCGSDGLVNSFSGGSGIAELPHEIFRDLLARFTDFDYADSNWTNWSTLNTARTGWLCNWWLLSLEDLKTVLEQVQYEGCFIFHYNVRGDGGSLIWVKDSYSDSDVEHTFDENDYDNIERGLTDLSEISTKTIYNYQKHPANNSYLETTTFTNANRTDYFPSVTNDNIDTKNLDFITADKVNTGSAANDCIARYYDNIVASPKIIIKSVITNMEKKEIEIGDIVKFNDSDITPFGKKWSDLYFMIVETRRSLNSLEIIAREVYEA